MSWNLERDGDKDVKAATVLPEVDSDDSDDDLGDDWDAI